MGNTSHDISWTTGAARPLFCGFTIKPSSSFATCLSFTVERRHALLRPGIVLNRASSVENHEKVWLAFLAFYVTLLWTTTEDEMARAGTGSWMFAFFFSCHNCFQTVYRTHSDAYPTGTNGSWSWPLASIQKLLFLTPPLRWYNLLYSGGSTYTHAHVRTHTRSGILSNRRPGTFKNWNLNDFYENVPIFS